MRANDGDGERQDNPLEIQVTWQHVVMIVFAVGMFVSGILIIMPLVSGLRNGEDVMFLRFGITGLLILPWAMWWVVTSQRKRMRREKRAEAPSVFELVALSDDGLLEISEALVSAVNWMPAHKVPRPQAVTMTAGGLTEWIEREMRAEAKPVWLRLTQVLELRNYLRQETSTPLAELALATPLKSIQFNDNFRKGWKRLSGHFGDRIPPLQLPSAVVWSLRVFAVAIVITIGAITEENLHAQGIRPPAGSAWIGRPLTRILVFVSAAILCFVLAVILRPFLSTYPRGCQTVGELARHVPMEAQQREDWDYATLWPEIRAIVANTHGVRIEQVRPDTRLVRPGMM